MLEAVPPLNQHSHFTTTKPLKHEHRSFGRLGSIVLSHQRLEKEKVEAQGAVRTDPPLLGVMIYSTISANYSEVYTFSRKGALRFFSYAENKPYSKKLSR